MGWSGLFASKPTPTFDCIHLSKCVNTVSVGAGLLAKGATRCLSYCAISRSGLPRTGASPAT